MFGLLVEVQFIFNLFLPIQLGFGQFRVEAHALAAGCIVFCISFPSSQRIEHKEKEGKGQQGHGHQHLSLLDEMRRMAEAGGR